MIAGPIPSPAPDADLLAPEVTPRRRRTAICGSLRIDGQPVTYAGLAAAGITFTPGQLNGTRFDQLALWCTQQHVAPGAGWTEDICTSNWSRGCPFAPPPSAPPKPTPAPPAPPPGDYRTRLWEVRAAIADRHILQLDVCEGIGRARSSVGGVLSGAQPSERILGEITRYLAIVRGKA